jgi:hypothetical protein
MRDALRVFAFWFVGGLLATATAVLAIRPLAGLLSLMVVVGLLAMLVAPAVHICLRRTKIAERSGGALSPVLIVLILLAATTAVLAITGLFNFA